MERTVSEWSTSYRPPLSSVSPVQSPSAGGSQPLEPHWTSTVPPVVREDLYSHNTQLCGSPSLSVAAEPCLLPALTQSPVVRGHR